MSRAINCAAFVSLWMSHSLLAATIHVPRQYSSIQAAVNAAAPGDTVLVAPGTYVENVTIQKSLRLRSGAGAITTTIDGGGRGSPVALWGTRTENITVQGFTLTGGSWNPEGGLVAEMTGGVIANNYIARNFAYDSPGLVLRNFQDPAMSFTVTGNALIDNRADGGVGAANLTAYRPSTITFRNNVVVGSSAGDMFLCTGDGVVASRNLVTNLGSGTSASTCGQ